jgi:tetratricopeptide (TPR) repeat protein
VHREIGYRSGEAIVINNIGNVYRELEEYDKALDYLAQASQLERETGDRATLMKTLNNVGAIYSSLGDLDKALDYYAQALTIATELEDGAMENNVRTGIAAARNQAAQKPHVKP